MKVDWNALRAEYIGGGVSQRDLAKKYGVSFNTLKDKANAEGWADAREKAHNKATTKAQQKVADTAADNAVKKQRLASLLLDAAVETVEAYRAKGTLKPNDIKLLSGVLKDFEGTTLAASTQDDPLLDMIARWDNASKR